MSNILFIGPVETSDGWGSACRDYVRALRETGHGIKLKNLYTTNVSSPYEEFNDLYSAKIDKFDYVIQNCMPSQFCYDKEFGKNIGLFYIENWGWKNNWEQNIKMMDDTWVSCDYSANCVYETVGIKPKAIPIPYDLDKFKISYKRIPEEVTAGRFMFYFVGEDIDRKNIDTLVKAFYLEFDRQENVGLLIKTNRVGGKPEQVYEVLNNRINKIKKDLNLYRGKDYYKNIVIITDRVPEHELWSIHSSCDCFVMPSSGEGWSMPAIDAAGFGKWVLMTENGAADYVADEKIDHIIENVYSEYHPMPDLVTGREYWLKPNLSDLKLKMRNIYNKHLEGKKPKDKNLEQLSYKRVAEKICQAL